MAAFNAADAERVAALFADDATVEDPVGGPMIAGRESILAFYRHATSLGARLEVVAAPRGSHGNAAALRFAVEVRMPAWRRCRIEE
ncbi:nuclear transport factor 2 family protein [Cupriavidus basilensis]